VALGHADTSGDFRLGEARVVESEVRPTDFPERDIFAREILDHVFERTLARDNEAADIGGRQARVFGQQRQSAIAALARDNSVVAGLGARHDDQVVEQAVLRDGPGELFNAAERLPDLLWVGEDAVERDFDDVAHPALT
jgi:hypothetical protein